MRILWIFSIFLVLGNIQEIFGFKKFWNGRRFEVEPTSVEDSEELWFDQQFDHFGTTDLDTWKQVPLIFVIFK